MTATPRMRPIAARGLLRRASSSALVSVKVAANGSGDSCTFMASVGGDRPGEVEGRGHALVAVGAAAGVGEEDEDLEVGRAARDQRAGAVAAGVGHEDR